MDDMHVPEGKLKGKYKRIGAKVGRVVIIMQAISIAVVMLVCVFMYNSLVTKMQTDRCTNGTNMLAYELDKLSEGDDPNQLLDELKNRMGCEFTIFEGDIRAYTTVTQDGQRVVGTQLSSDLNKIVLQQGDTYVGESEIQGASFLCSYVPTKGDDGKINGLIFAGISREDAKQEVILVVALSILVSAVVIGICIMFLTGYMKKRVSNPLGKITSAAGRLEQGDLGLADNEDIRIDISSNDEIGTLAQMFEDTFGRLRSYIGEISDVLEAMASGNMTQGASQDYLGDFQSIKKSLDKIQSALNHTMGQISTSAEQVSSGAEQVSSSSQALAQGATEQASSIEEISATMAEISQNAKQTAEAAEKAGEYVNEAGSHLGVSICFVDELNVAMKNISDSSKKIGTIITTIEDIAFQINILSLNAAVEAARAGSAGKGFAVVASEIGGLAGSSAQASQNITELIQKSIAAVNNGVTITGETVEMMEGISKISSEISQNISRITDTSRKQDDSLKNMLDSANEIAAVIDQNTAAAEESSALSEELLGYTENVMAQIEKYKIKEN